MIEIKDISFSYSTGNVALDEINLLLDSKQKVGLVGANGAGKSSLFKLLVGINQPSKGTISFNNMTTNNKKDLINIRKSIGLIMQNPDEQLFMNTVYEDIAFGPENFGKNPNEVKELVKKYSDQMKVSHLLGRSSNRLSGGEKRSVAIAAVLACEPSYLLMDEPTSFLDPSARRKVIEMIHSLELGCLIAAHDLDMVLDTCDRVIVLSNGKIVADGVPKDILLDKALMENSGLELPLCAQAMRNL